MKLRELPGALILGLLASLLAHAATFGNGHAAGGPYHEVLCSLALAGGVGFGIAATLLARFGARRLTQGSVLAARLAPLVPQVATVTAFATPMFFAIEAVESRHAGAATALVGVALLLASLVVSKLAQLCVRAIAAVVFAVAAHPFAARLRYAIRRASSRPRARSARYAYRRFARPPPQLMLVYP